MSKIKTFLYLLNNNRRGALYTILQKCNAIFTDSIYLRLLFFLRVGYKLNLKQPRTYNEKLQWLKLYNRRPEYKKMVDKYEVKEYIKSKIGNEYVIPTYGVWDNIETIDWDSLPERFVIKTTHGGGGCGVVICRDRSSFNRENAIKELRRSLTKDIYKELREWPYKDMKKRILAEKLLTERGLDSPRDYKVMCFNGKVKMIEYHEGRFSNHHTQGFYDREWKKMPINQKSYGEITNEVSEKPALLDEMIGLSEILAEGIPHVRIDWYMVQNHLFFGEITFFDASGFDEFIPEEYNKIIGNWITLPEKTI